MLVVTRHRVADSAASDFVTQAGAALAVLGQRPGFVDGALGRNVDDPDPWVPSPRRRATGPACRAAGGGAPRPLGGPRRRHGRDPARCVLSPRWRDTGSYRRALSAFDVKMTAVPLLS